MKHLSIFILASLLIVACKTTKKSEGTTTKVEEAVSYSNAIKSVINKKCIYCHRGDQAARGLDLSTYEGVRAATETGTLLDRINNAEKPMPKAGLMSEKNRALFQKWVENNYAKE